MILVLLLALLLISVPASAQQTVNANMRGLVTSGAQSYGVNTLQYLTIDSSGALKVVITGGAGSGGTSSTDQAAWLAGSTAGTPMMGARDDAASSTLAEDTLGVVRMTTNRAIHVNLRDAAGNEVTVGGGTQYDQGTATTATDKLTMAGAVRHDTATVDAGVADGDRVVLSTDSAGRLRVTAADTTQPVSGTVAVSGTVTVAGAKSNNAVAPGATNLGTLPALANAAAPTWTEGNQVALSVDLTGALRVSGGSGGTQYDQGTATTSTDKLTMAGAVRHDTAVVDAGVADGDRLVLSTDASGRLRTTSADVTQPVSGTVAISGTVAVTQSTSPWVANVTQFGSNNVVTGTGASGVGIPRVTISNDSSLAANQSVNVNQWGGTGTTLGQKAMTASVPVVIASDQSAVTITGTVTTTPPANASTNVAQFGGTNVSTGTGASGAGIPRVTVANDSNILATQSGTWTVTANAGTNLNTSALLLDATFTGRINTQGQKTMAASTPVVIASDQSAVPVSGTVTANQGGAPWSVVGTKTNNNAAPGATNVGVLPGVATNAAPSYTEGNQVALSTDLTGALRVAGGGGLSVTDSATWTSSVSAFTPTGGEYNPTATPLTSGTQGTVALTSARGLQTNLVDSAGRELGAVLPGKYSPPQQVSLAPAMPAPPQLGAVTRFINFVTGQGLGTPVNLVTAMGGQSSTGVMPTIYCNKSVSISTAASGNTQLVPLVGSQAIYVCGLDWISTSALSVKFVYGTGSACGTGQTDLEGAQAVAANGGKVIPVAMPKWFIPAGQALCINLSGATQVSGSLTYGQF